LGTISGRTELLKREDDHSLQPTAEVQNAWICTSNPPPPSWRALERVFDETWKGIFIKSFKVGLPSKIFSGRTGIRKKTTLMTIK
jgi:hypothetical protein